MQTDLIHLLFQFNDKNHNVVAMFGCCPYYKTPEKGAAWWLSTDEPFKSWHYLRNQKEHLNGLQVIINLFLTLLQQNKNNHFGGYNIWDLQFLIQEVLVKNVKMKYFYIEPKGFNGEPIDDVCGPRWRTLNQNSTDNS